MITSGDVVQSNNRELVVVDVVADDEGGQLGVLRDPSDVELLNPIVVPGNELTVTGHLGRTMDAPEGWIEHFPGVWEKVTE